MKQLPKGSLTTQYIGGIVADQLYKMTATIIGSKVSSTVQTFALDSGIILNANYKTSGW